MEVCEKLLTNNHSIYILAIQCIRLFYYVCFNAFGPFSRELCCVAYRLAASVIVNKRPIKPEKALGKMTAPCVESSSVSKKKKKHTVTLCLSNYGDKCCKLNVLMFGLCKYGKCMST